MADARISQLPAATTVASADIIPFTSISGSETRKITATNLGKVLTQLGLSVGTSAPSSPYNGQLWVDTSTNPPVLKVYNGASFTTVSYLPGSAVATSPGTTAPSSPVLGQLWQDTSQSPDELKMYDGSSFVRVDPLGITDAAAAAKYLQITTAAATYLALTGGTLTGNLTLNGAPTTNNMAATKKYVDDEIAAIPSADSVPAGTVIYTARSSAPTGYLKANGAAVSRTTYSDLFSAIGTTYGSGDGSTTFNLPDLRGEFVRGVDDGRGVDSGRSLGSTQGSANLSHTHTATTTIGAHTHTGTTGNPSVDLSHDHDITYYEGGDNSDRYYLSRFFTGNSTHTATTDSSGDLDHTHSFTTDSTTPSGTTTLTNSGGTEARPRNLALLACIKT
jgi:microcystin-dependent protein